MNTATIDPALVTVIEAVVDDKVNRCEMFTAFDVSVEVKNRGHREKHNNMKDVVHNMYANGRMQGYTRTLVDIPGTNQAWCYHGVNYDPTGYTPIPRQGDKVIVPTPVIHIPTVPTSNLSPTDFYNQNPIDPNDPNDPTSAIDPNLNAVQPSVANTSPAPLICPVPATTATKKQRGRGIPDARGTLCISADTVRAAGFKTLDKVFAAVDVANNQVVICAVKDDAEKVSPDVHAYTVDSHDNIRLTRFVLESAKVNSQNGSYNFSGQANQIVVK